MNQHNVCCVLAHGKETGGLCIKETFSFRIEVLILKMRFNVFHFFCIVILQSVSLRHCFPYAICSCLPPAVVWSLRLSIKQH